MQRFADMTSRRCVGALFASLFSMGFDQERKSRRNITGHLSSINGLRTFPRPICMPQGPTSPPEEASSQSGRVRYQVAESGDQGQRIDNFLLRVLKNVPRSLVYRILRTGEVRVNGGRVKPDHRLEEGDRVRIPPIVTKQRAETEAPSKSLRDFITKAVIYEDRELFVINKPAGVAVHGGSGLSHGVIEALRAVHPELKELELVHRLDRDTSGCLLIAKRRSALRELHRTLRERQMQKHYRALVVGRWPFGRKLIDLPLKTNQKQGGERVVRVHPEGQHAESTFEPLQHFGKIATLLDVNIGTGRTHQIRVHAAHAGHPIAGDEKYGDRERDAALKPFGLHRMFLHAYSLSFHRVGVEKEFTVAAPLPEDLQNLLDRLSEQSKPVC
jgi:23S rRNA pseudouridine955/2504/2580 synthase